MTESDKHLAVLRKILGSCFDALGRYATTRTFPNGETIQAEDKGRYYCGGIDSSTDNFKAALEWAISRLEIKEKI